MPVRRAFSRAAIRAASREGANRRPARLARPRASGGRPAALHVTDDTGRHLRYTSRAKREADVSLSHRCTMEHQGHHIRLHWLSPSVNALTLQVLRKRWLAKLAFVVGRMYAKASAAFSRYSPSSSFATISAISSK